VTFLSVGIATSISMRVSYFFFNYCACRKCNLSSENEALAIDLRSPVQYIAKSPEHLLWALRYKPEGRGFDFR